MSSISEELAALRSAGTVRQHASALKSKSGTLSTPEAEEATLSKARKDDKLKKVEAEELLRKSNATGNGLVDVALKKVGERKKMDERERVEARQILSEGLSGSAATVDVSREKASADEGQTIVPTETAISDVVEMADNIDLEEEVPNLEQLDTTEPAQTTQIVNRNEKKVRKLMSRLDMSPVSDIVRAVMKTSGGNFFIENPDVYVSNKSKSETYVIFGEARKQQTFRKSAAERAVEVLQQAAVAESANANTQKEEVDNGEGLDDKDVELVMSQASVKRSVAVKALKENDGDLVNAIMSLTT